MPNQHTGKYRLAYHQIKPGLPVVVEVVGLTKPVRCVIVGYPSLNRDGSMTVSVQKDDDTIVQLVTRYVYIQP